MGSGSSFLFFSFCNVRLLNMLLYIADFNGVVLVQNYLQRAGREEWAKQVISFACKLLSSSTTQPLIGVREGNMHLVFAFQ